MATPPHLRLTDDNQFLEIGPGVQSGFWKYTNPVLDNTASQILALNGAGQFVVKSGAPGPSVTSASSSTTPGNVATYADTLGQSIQQSPVNITGGGAVTGVASINGSAVPPTGFGDVVGPPSSVDNHLAVFSGTTGKLVKDSAPIVVNGGNITNITTINGANPPAPGTGDFGNVTGPVSSTAGHIATYANGTGRLLQDASPIVVSGADLLGVSTINGAAYPPAGVGSGNVVGPVSSVVGHLALYNNTTGNLLSDPSPITVTGGALTGVTTINGFTPGAGSGNVTGPGSSTDNHIALYNGATGALLKDTSPIIVSGPDISGISTINGAAYPPVGVGSGNVVGPATSTAGHIAVYNNATGNLLSDPSPIVVSGGALTGVTTINGFTPGVGSGNVTGPGSATDNHLALYNGPSGALIKDSSPISVIGGALSGVTTINGAAYPPSGVGTGNVVGPVSSTIGHLAVFNNTAGNLLADSSPILVSGGNITNVTTINGSVPPLSGNFGNVTGPASSVTGHLATYADGTGKLLQDASPIIVSGADLLGVSTINGAAYPPAGVGSGNVVGPVSSMVGHIAIYNNATGNLLSDPSPILVTGGALTGVTTINGFTPGAGSGNVTGPGSSTDNHLALYNGVTGALLKDTSPIVVSGPNLSGVGTINGAAYPPVGVGSGNVVGPATSTVGHLAVYNNTTGNLLSDPSPIVVSGGALTGVTTINGFTPGAGSGNVTGPGSATDNHIALYNGPSGALIKDSSPISVVGGALSGVTTINGASYPPSGVGTGNVVGPASSTVGHLALFNNSIGNLIADSSPILVAGGNIFNVSTINGSVLPISGNFGNVTGPATSTTGHLATYADGTGKLIQDATSIIASGGALTGVSTINGAAYPPIGVGTGNVVGPATSTVGHIAIYNNATGNLLSDPSPILVTGGALTGVTTINGFAPGAGSGNVTGPGSSTDNHIALYNGATGALLKDTSPIVVSGANLSGVGTINGAAYPPVGVGSGNVVGPATSTVGHIAIYNNATGNLLSDPSPIVVSGGALTGVTTINGFTPGVGSGNVTGPASSTDNHLALYNGASGALLKDTSPIVVSGGALTGVTTINGAAYPPSGVGTGNVVGPASSTVGHLALFNNSIGNLIADASPILVSGGAISNITTINGAAYPPPGGGTGNVVGPATSTIGHLAIFNNAVGTLLSDPSPIAVSGGALTGVTTINGFTPAGGNVTGPVSSTVGHLAIFNNTSGTLLSDPSPISVSGGDLAGVTTLDGVDPSTWVVGPATSNNSRIALFSGLTGKLLKDTSAISVSGGAMAGVTQINGVPPGNVTGPGSAFDGHLALYDGMTGLSIKDTSPITVTSGDISGIVTINGAAPGDVVGPASSANSRIALFNGLTGKLLKDTSSISVSGGAMAGVTQINGTPPGNVSGPGSSTDNHLALFDGSTGFAIKDTSPILVSSGGDLSNVLTINGAAYPPPGGGSGNVVGPASSTIGHLAIFNNAVGTLLSDPSPIVVSGGALSGVTTINGFVPGGGGGNVTGPGSSTDNHLALFNGASGALIKDSSPIVVSGGAITGVTTINGFTPGPASGDVVGPGSAFNNRLPTFSGPTGKLIADSCGISASAGGLQNLISLDFTNTFTPITSGTVIGHYQIDQQLINVTGPWSVSLPMLVTVQRVGALVTCRINGLAPSAASLPSTNAQTSANTVATWARNASLPNPNGHAYITNNSVLTHAIWSVNFANGQILFTPIGGGFAGTGNAGISATTLTWMVV